MRPHIILSHDHCPPPRFLEDVYGCGSGPPGWTSLLRLLLLLCSLTPPPGRALTRAARAQALTVAVLEPRSCRTSFMKWENLREGAGGVAGPV